MLNKSDNNKGPSRSVTYWGNSLFLGVGATFGESVVYWMRLFMPDRLHYAEAIGGQNSDQIFARQGSIPIKVTLAGNAIPTGSPVVATPNISFFSAPGDVSNREVGGFIDYVIGSETFTGRVPIGIYRTGATDVYTGIAMGKPFAGTVPTNALVTLNSSINGQPNIQALWAFRNDSDKSPSIAIAKYKAAMDYLLTPKRAIVLGELTLKTETEGTPGYDTIIALNDALRTEFTGRYVEMTPPTTEEMAITNYTLSVDGLDQQDIDNGIWPRGMRPDAIDTIHLNGAGYKVIALRIARKLNALRW
jgi:hypothetical protein